jgi:hypothetical protein
MIRARGLAISGPTRRLHDHEAERAAVIKAAENSHNGGWAGVLTLPNPNFNRRDQEWPAAVPGCWSRRLFIIAASAESRRRASRSSRRCRRGDGAIGSAALRPAFGIGPGVVRYVLMQDVQGQVTVERRLAQLKGLGVRISKGHIVALLTANKDVFHTEKDALLEAGLATARWVTVDDTAARHAGREEYTTHIGDDRFA